MQHVGIIWGFCLPRADFLSFSLPGVIKNCWIKSCGLIGGISTLADTMPNLTILTSRKSQFFLSTMGANIQASYEKMELLALSWWFSGPIKIIGNETSTCKYYKYILGSCWSELTKLFLGRLSPKYFRELHISLMV